MMRTIRDAWNRIRELAGAQPLLNDKDRLDALALALVNLEQRIAFLEARPYPVLPSWPYPQPILPSVPWVTWCGGSPDSPHPDVNVTC